MDLPPHTDRRTFLRLASAAAAIPATAGIAAGWLSLDQPRRASAAPSTATPADDLPDYAPVPPAALGPALNDDGYFVGHIGGNLYWVTDSFTQVMFLTTTKGVVCVDATPTLGHNLLRAIEGVAQARRRPSRVTHLIYSHFHADHIGAASIFEHGVTRIAHRETKRLLKAAGDPNRPLPDVTFDDHYVLEVGDERLELTHYGPNHTPDTIFIRVPSAETLMVVDVIFPGWVPYKNFAESSDIMGWIDAHDTVLAIPWQTLVGGHMGRLGTRDDAVMQRAYVKDLIASADAAIAAVDPSPFFAKYIPIGNAWGFARSYIDALADQAAAPVAAKYTGLLAAADVFTTANAAAMVNSRRIDSGILGPLTIHP
jgi:glyoxylase-like metal-dependent hydrolase (beta-lactamase superfamily II)